MRVGVIVTVLLGSLAFATGCAGEEDGAGPATTEPETTVEQPATTSEPPTTTAPETTTEAAAPGDGRGLGLVEVAAGLDSPLHLTSAPGEPGRLYVVEQVGRIRVLAGGRLVPAPFLDIQEKVVSGGEQGLLSVAFHPDYDENRLFYANYTDTQGDTVVEEYRARGSAAPARVRELLHVDQPYSNHNGGQLVFGPDGLLYVGMGDGGAAGDPENRAQDLDDRLGKLLRLDVDREGADWELVAYGLRNPWRFSFDRETGDLWIGDVGQGDLEEIDFQPAGSRGLVNYGWDVFEGSQVFEDKEPNPAGRLVGPIVEYSHSEGRSVTGGFVYRGEDVPAASGRYFYGDYSSGFVWSLVERGGEATDVRRAPFEVPGLSSFGEDARGELYLVSLAGAVYRLASR
jgi:glucose/arabinose dehydrogenase